MNDSNFGPYEDQKSELFTQAMRMGAAARKLAYLIEEKIEATTDPETRTKKDERWLWIAIEANKQICATGNYLLTLNRWQDSLDRQKPKES